jgi:hypothetical protein
MGEQLEHPWEYIQIVQVTTPKNKLDYSTKEGQQALINESGKIFNNLPQIIDKMRTGGGWQVNSHSILMVDGSIMVSVLLQRLKGGL